MQELISARLCVQLGREPTPEEVETELVRLGLLSLQVEALVEQQPPVLGEAWEEVPSPSPDYICGSSEVAVSQMHSKRIRAKGGASVEPTDWRPALKNQAAAAYRESRELSYLCRSRQDGSPLSNRILLPRMDGGMDPSSRAPHSSSPLSDRMLVSRRAHRLGGDDPGKRLRRGATSGMFGWNDMIVSNVIWIPPALQAVPGVP
eukprot:CAMPEP_0181189226 /NCGR_PEP_ID=MMETSP1096-20121128/11550_1 /TAXON_ID=156174 ORGANISM="Chrysochromulina ericina, Strain CCMP281" /NCGR_SAMPLE_ID=MMETSP1096 /ASSEMBLY_ACC=CAM_ASM_000453 /LENGTH=203 /DNA_ID=CAMNT_0023278367 /DNA_START=465 /DNA_END=1077 /DNA_ORIENTATION=-